MDEETMGLNMSRRTKTPNNILIDVEKLGDVVRVGMEYEQERITELLEDLLADDFIGVFQPDGNTVQYSKADFIEYVTKGEYK